MPVATQTSPSGDRSWIRPGSPREPRLPLEGVAPSIAAEIRVALVGLGLLPEQAASTAAVGDGRRGWAAPAATVWRGE